MTIRSLLFLACFLSTTAARAQVASDSARLRGGFSGNLGMAFTGESAGPVLGLTGRVGVQMTPLFGL